MVELYCIPLTGKQAAAEQRAGATGGVVFHGSPRIDATVATSTAYALWATPDGRLRAAPLDHEQQGAPAPASVEALIAVLKCRIEDGSPAWYAVPCSTRLGINGMAPLALVRLEPGALLSVDRKFWFLALLWRPEPMAAPPEVADEACAICGAPLSAAPVVQCADPSCGRYTHLERPEDPQAEDALNCYLIAGKCGGCGHPASLDPIVVPQPDEKLLPLDEDDEALLPIGDV